MRTNYLLIAFIAAAVLFFYFAGNFKETGNPLVPGNTDASSTQSVGNSTGSVKNGNPSSFQGPKIKPGEGFIGPSGPPPNY